MADLRSDTPVQFVKGVGPRRAEALATVGVHSVGELLEYFPFRYEDDQGDVEIADVTPGQQATIWGAVVRVGGRAPGLRCTVDDGTARCTLRWFNRTPETRGLTRGVTVCATGKVDHYDDHPQMVQPRIEIYAPDTPRPTSARQGARRLAVYPASAAASVALIRRTVQSVLEHPVLPVEEFLPSELLRRRGWPVRAEAVRQMHAPTDDAALAQARARLAYEELFLLELGLALRRRRQHVAERGVRLEVTPEIDQRIRARFPFRLTAAQDGAITEIAADLGSGQPMTRLLQGDVGSGKTVVALYAALAAIAQGKQAAIMAPTEILAAQHAGKVAQYLAGSRVRAALLSSALKDAARIDILNGLSRGHVDLAIGTHALLETDVQFNDLALVVIDEQHKFGVLQRHAFRTKGPAPHYLVMTATPIPRTLALTVFGDLDVSVLRAGPPGRGTIHTRVVRGEQWDAVTGYVRQRLEAGEQAFVVCPRIGEGDPEADLTGEAARPGAEIASVEKTQTQLATGPWRGLRVGQLHGGLSSEEKQRTIAAFARGELHALVATTVVEVGVDVPNATVMVVEHAERFGLAQLHQLRGRVGRGRRESLCVFIARGHSPRAAERLAVLAETTDGFRIAEEDLRQRGPGELVGTRQHGLPTLKVADLLADVTLLTQARDEAFVLADDDPRLTKPGHLPLRAALLRLFGDKLGLVEIG